MQTVIACVYARVQFTVLYLSDLIKPCLHDFMSVLDFILMFGN